jgi:hypothetical protein
VPSADVYAFALDVRQGRRVQSIYNRRVKTLYQPMKFMRTLALVAAALLAMAPTLGRLSASPSVAAATTEAMCTTKGLETLALPIGDSIPAAPRTHEDCGYCALLASSSPALPALAMDVPRQTGTADTALRLVAPFLAKSNFPALGSRGPPAL